MKKLFTVAAGSALVVVGAAGVVLPILPGWPFLFVGLAMVAPRQAVRLRRWVNRRFLKQETVHLSEWTRADVHAGFTTRHFPLVLRKTDDLLDPTNQGRFRELLWKAHVALAREKASEGRLAFLNQVHEDHVVVLEDSKQVEKPGFHHFLKADAAITNIERLTLLVMTADCLSIFFYAPKDGKASWVGLAHAGWRGTKLGIARKTVRLLSERSGVPPSAIRVAFGPCIRPRNYEVGPEFRDHFPASSLRTRGQRLHFDLAGENRRQLLEAGVRPVNITDSRICTVSENRSFYSFRKEKEAAGRMISFITLV